tara:strand:+ start:1117 stop:1317 length:201 start_codon:yes stop_codon:yes gene_type:complete
MTRKDYELIAAALKRAREPIVGQEQEFNDGYSEAMDSAAEELAKAFAEENRRFDRARFLKASGAAE